MSAVSEAIEASEIFELQRKLPGVQAELSRMEEALIARVFSAIEGQKLSQEQAMYSWLELMTLRQLARRLTTRVRVGQAAAERVATGAMAPTDGGR